MNGRVQIGAVLGALVLGGLAVEVRAADLPPNFPAVSVTTYQPDQVGDGFVFLAVATETEGIGTYLMILRNDGTPVWTREVDTHEIYDFKVQANGMLSYAPFIEAHNYTGGGDVTHEILDDAYAIRETVSGGNGYVAEAHDFQVLPNGHILQFGYYLSEVDMSQIVEGGYPAALVSGGVVQELDAQRSVVWQRRDWDHTRFEDVTFPSRTAASRVISMFHLNTVNLDHDGHLILGTPSAVRKINRQTGQVMWVLGGADNQFTPLGPAADVSHFGGHATCRIPNGNFLMYDNAPRRGGGSSQVHEYTLDEEVKTATHVWSWAPSIPVAAWHRGNAQRLPNGNTFIGWGGASGDHIPACTEVAPDGEVVFELFFDQRDPQIESYRAFRFPYPPDTLAVEALVIELVEGSTYAFGETGLELEIQSFSGDGYNDVTVTREPYAPVTPAFTQTAPRVLPVRVDAEPYGFTSVAGRVSFDVDSFAFTDPVALTIYHRETPGQGIFVALPTDYNPVTRRLRAPIDRFGEFIFGFPDLVHVPYPPLLSEPENDRGVQTHMVIAPKLAEAGVVTSLNQERPIAFSWSPLGFASWYELEIDTDPSFAAPVVDVPYQTEATFLWAEALPGTNYYYRVRTHNDGGDSEWSQGAFQTTAPAIELVAPNGGEVWERGRSYFVRWSDNVAEPVVIELYLDGVYSRDIATDDSSSVFEWEVDFDLQPAADYRIQVRSSTDSSLAAPSALVFSIVDAPTIGPGQVQQLPDGRAQIEVNIPGATQATVFGSEDLSSWQPLETVPLNNGSGVFTDQEATVFPSRFYRFQIP